MCRQKIDGRRGLRKTWKLVKQWLFVKSSPQNGFDQPLRNYTSAKSLTRTALNCTALDSPYTRRERIETTIAQSVVTRITQPNRREINTCIQTSIKAKMNHDVMFDKVRCCMSTSSVACWSPSKSLGHPLVSHQHCHTELKQLADSN